MVKGEKRLDRPIGKEGKSIRQTGRQPTFIYVRIGGVRSREHRRARRTVYQSCVVVMNVLFDCERLSRGMGLRLG